MKNKLIALLVTAVFVSCDDAANTKQNETGIKDSATTECYSSINDKDSITLNITTIGKNVTGELYYNIQEKDKNVGAIEGEMVGDTIFAEYAFTSEGMQSIREVAFLKNNNTLVEGFGPVEDMNGKVVFKNRSTLVFNNANMLKKVDCPPNP